jgi:hypothetical protein
LQDFEVFTGFALAHAWQQERGPIPVGMRLIPKVPFVLGGGEFSSANLSLSDAVHGMRLRARLAVRLHNLPDGSAVRLRVDH